MVTIVKDRTKKLYNSEKSLFVTFPFDYDIVMIIKNSPIRLFDPVTKAWELPENQLNRLTNVLTQSGYAYEYIDKSTEQVRKQVTEQVEYEPLDLPDDVEFKTTPHEYQKYAVEYGLKHDSFLLGDKMGLGKTKEMLDLAVYRKKRGDIKRCLVICGVNTLKYNWLAEIKKHTNENGWILGTRYDKKGKPIVKGTKEKMEDLDNLPDCTFIITNVETLRISEKVGRSRDFTFVNKINELVKRGEIGMVLVDEAHKCRNIQSQQGKALLKLNAPYKVPMSGTFFYNSPLDLYVPLSWIGEENHSYWQYRNYYCILGGFNNAEVLGTKNLDKLKETLNRCMLRRTTEEVLDLPPKNRITELVEMTDNQTKVYNAVIQMLREDVDKIKASNNPLAQFIRLRQATGYTGILSSTVEESAKLDRMEELVEEITMDGGKVVIFSQWEQITAEAKKRLEKYNPLYITGKTSDYDRDVAREMFQTDDIHKVIIGTSGAMGTGITLTRASTAIFLDSPWTMSEKEQNEDRIYRIGTTQSVNIITLVCKDTIDEKIEDIVYGKGEMGDYLLDGKLKKDKVDEFVKSILWG